MNIDKEMNATRVINEGQLKSYQKVDENRAKRLFHIFEDVLAEKKERGDIQILDMGGGANFTALVGEYYDGRAKVYCLDNAAYGTWDGFSDRVEFKLGSVDEIATMFGEKTFDIIFANGLFHHLVRDGFRQTVDGMCKVLAQTHMCLKDYGCLCITDETADSYIDGVLTWLIYRLTTVRNRRIATLLKRFDVKSAGIRGLLFVLEKMGGGISESRISSIDGKHRENPFAEVVYEAALAAERILVYRVLGL